MYAIRSYYGTDSVFTPDPIDGAPMQALRIALEARAFDEGFADFGVCAPGDVAEAGAKLRRWVEEGRQGDIRITSYNVCYTKLLRARKPVLKQGSEGWTGFYARIPVFRGVVMLPWHIAAVVEAGQVRRRREVGDGQAFARQPVPRLGQPADVVEVNLDVPGPRLDLGSYNFV